MSTTPDAETTPDAQPATSVEAPLDTSTGGSPEESEQQAGAHPEQVGGTDVAPGGAQQDQQQGDDRASEAEGDSGDLVREGEIAADFLETLLDIADLDGDLEVDVEGQRAAVAIVDSEDGSAPRKLVGPGGAVLEALQELTRLAVQAETGDRSRLMLDVAGYRADRRGALVRQARSAIAEVKESGERRELEPMTAFERKVVHDEVLAAGLTSESEGAEPSRYVVILPAS